MSDALTRVIDQLRAVGEPSRLRILALLRRGDLAVGELVQILGQSQPRLSHHLKVLASAGLVERLPEGSWVFYRAVSSGGSGDFLDAVFARIGEDEAGFARDREQLEQIAQARQVEAEAYFNDIAENWDTLRALHYPNQAIEDAVLALAGPGPFRQLIDIGTGTGRMLALLAPRAHGAEGLDLSHQMLTLARSNLAAAGIGHARVRQGDACATPFASRSADLVIIHQVLHFIDTPARVLAEADRLLMSGGRVIIVDFAPHDLEFLRTDYGHRRLGIREDAMREWSATTRLDISEVRSFSPPTDKPAGLGVRIWTLEKQASRKEAAA